MTDTDILCSIPGCIRREHARGWCGTHYARWYRNGGPEASKPRPPKLDRSGWPVCKWCHKPCDGRCANFTPAEIAYTDRLIAAGVIG